MEVKGSQPLTDVNQAGKLPVWTQLREESLFYDHVEIMEPGNGVKKKNCFGICSI